MRKIKILLSLILIVSFLIPSNLAFASIKSDSVYQINIMIKHDKPLPGDDSLYYGYVDLDQWFSPDLLNYTATAESDVNTVKIEVKTTGNVTITGDGEYDLNTGENTIKVAATKSDGTSVTYTFVIDKLVPDEDNTNLWELYVADGQNNQYIENFDPSITTYNATVENEITEVTVGGIPETDLSTVNGEKNDFKLKTGINKFKLKVVSQSGKTKDYIINIERKKSSDVSLYGISVNGDNIIMNGKKNLTEKVLYDTNTVNITADVCSEATKVEGIGIHKVKVGSNNIKLTVIAENGNKVIYNLNIIRAKPTTALSNLEINQYTCGIEGNKLNIDVDNSTTKAKIKATAVDVSAKVTGNGTYNLKVGKNTFYITVKAADGKTKRYTIAINRSKYKKITVIIIWD